MKKWSIAALLAAALIMPNHSVLSAAGNNTVTNVIINNAKLAPEHILLKNNQVFISLTEAKGLDDLTFQWNNATKQVTVTGKETNLLLTINDTTAQKNGVPVELSTAPFIHEGKTMIPLRFVTEAMNSTVTWNQSLHTAFITKASSKLISDFDSDQLSRARNAAINMPRVSELPEMHEPTLDTFSLQYYFPERTSDRFVEVNNNVVSYYEISGHTAYLKWQGVTGNETSTRPDLYFINRSITGEVGTLPDFTETTFASFRWMPHIVSTGYSLINKQNWNDVLFNDEEILQNHVRDNYIIVEIPEETQG